MSTTPTPLRRRTNWTPYLLILPSLIYLLLFFAWPMARGLVLAVWDNDALLALHSEAQQDSAVADHLPQGTQVDILDQQGNFISPEALAEGGNLLTVVWFRVRGVNGAGQPVEGWAAESRIRVREEAADGTPLQGTVRTSLSSTADPFTTLYAEPNDNSAVMGQLEARVPVDILEQATLELWYRVQGEYEGEVITGWTPARYLQVFGEGARGRVDRGNSGQLTTDFIQRMVNDRFFWPAFRTTLLLMVLIIPTQFVLAIIMALVIQARLKGSTLFLYIFAIPLAVSDLAVGILWFSIFTQNGYLNSLLQGAGLIDAPATYLSADSRQWIIVAVWLAEVWRATSIVMIIVVSGLQAISQEVLEAAELFGATLWQRLRYIILPLLRPSLQVALILRTILALQVFAVVVALSGGDVVTVLANETYRQYNEFRNPNVAAAYATFILLISMVSAAFYLRALRTQGEVAT
ncbi:MAG: ABC transporter permease subunit [Chloroflexi bacterium]|nr:ABC transporter permease subunit [Chloroflexota bacterium]MBP8054623.1 ABC transporter permease subunit [Chloroflexota bacterium]